MTLQTYLCVERGEKYLHKFMERKYAIYFISFPVFSEIDNEGRGKC